MAKSPNVNRPGKDAERVSGLRFEACEESLFDSLPSNEEWINPHLVTVRVAAALLCKSKPELQKLWAENPSLQFETLAQLAGTQEVLREILRVLQSAEARVIVAGEAATRQ